MIAYLSFQIHNNNIFLLDILLRQTKLIVEKYISGKTVAIFRTGFRR